MPRVEFEADTEEELIALAWRWVMGPQRPTPRRSPSESRQRPHVPPLGTQYVWVLVEPGSVPQVKPKAQGVLALHDSTHEPERGVLAARSR